MTRTASLASLALAVACTREDGRTDTAALTSGVVVTQTTLAPLEVTGAEPTEDASPFLAIELCRHEWVCGRIEAGGSDEARLLGACVANATTGVLLSMESWECSPAQRRGRIEECLATIRTQGCDVVTSSLESVPVCRPSVVCGG